MVKLKLFEYYLLKICFHSIKSFTLKLNKYTNILNLIFVDCVFVKLKMVRKTGADNYSSLLTSRLFVRVLSLYNVFLYDTCTTKGYTSSTLLDSQKVFTVFNMSMFQRWWCGVCVCRGTISRLNILFLSITALYLLHTCMILNTVWTL